MLTHNNKLLRKLRDKSGGKNQGELDGFYTDEEKEFFIKKPADKKELFTELLAGFLLNEFVQRGLIDNIYAPSLIVADVIRFEDGSYGLIQPCVKFTELFKIIGTGFSDNSDRNPFIEMMAGPRYYASLTKKDYFALPMTMMLSALFSDYSGVHSGNMVVLDEKPSAGGEQIGRIDWGSSFRHFAQPDNNKTILHPYEYQGWYNVKWFTKGYLANYKPVRGLFTAMGQEAHLLLEKINSTVLSDIVASAFKRIPADLLDKKTSKDLANYLNIPSFARATFGSDGEYSDALTTFTTVLQFRLKKLADLQNHGLDANRKDHEAKPYNANDYQYFKTQALKAISEGDLPGFRKLIASSTYCIEETGARTHTPLSDSTTTEKPSVIIIDKYYLDNPLDKRAFLDQALEHQQNEIINFLFSEGLGFSKKQFKAYAEKYGYLERYQNMMHLFPALKLLKSKAQDLTDRGFDLEAIYLLNLLSSIKSEMKAYMDNPISELEAQATFKQNCSQKIEEATQLLGQHRGYKQMLGNLGYAVLGLGVFYVIAATTQWAMGGSFFFQFNTKSQEDLSTLDQSIKTI